MKMWLQEMKLHQSQLHHPCLTHQGSGPIPHVWLNSKFRTQLYTQMESKAVESQPELTEDDVSDTELVSSGSEDKEA